jgi:hypothetical protein
VKSFPAFGILFGTRGQAPQLRKLLMENSNLPGPRGNLELAHSFAASIAAMHIDDWQWDFLMEMAGTSAAKAPVNTPGEFLPFCALLALGALYGNGLPRPRRRAALATLIAASSDTRWRVREGVAMGLQLIGERDPSALRGIVSDWLPSASFLEMRAIAAGLAHPPLLGDADFALFCVETAATILSAISRVDAKLRKTEGFKVLRQGMGYAVSVYVAHSPAEGFTLLRKSAAVRDSDIAWIIRENLKKKRISGPYPEDVGKVELIAEEANAR